MSNYPTVTPNVVASFRTQNRAVLFLVAICVQVAKRIFRILAFQTLRTAAKSANFFTNVFAKTSASVLCDALRSGLIVQTANVVTAVKYFL